MNKIDEAKELLRNDHIDEALNILNEYIKIDPKSDEAYYLRGNVYRKLEMTQLAINNYLAAIEINPDSPAQEAYNMMIKILNFYNPDMFNH